MGRFHWVFRNPQQFEELVRGHLILHVEGWRTQGVIQRARARAEEAFTY
jgi:hypothetical protein